jgi:hypothetical protein
MSGAVALRVKGDGEPVSGPRSDRVGQLGERGSDPLRGRDIDGKFVVTAS